MAKAKTKDRDQAPGSAPEELEDIGNEAGSRNKAFVNSLARGLSVVKAFTSQAQHMTLSEVADIVKLPRATTRRILLTLEQLGYVQLKDRLFSLSPMVLTIAQAYLSSSVLPRVSQSFLEQLSEELHESCSMSILHGADAIYVARSARKRISSLHRDVGTRLPAFCTSMGRVLLAALPETALDDYFREATFTAFTSYTVTSQSKLRAILKQVAKDGYCVCEQELEPNLRGIAVPVRNTAGAVVGAVNASSNNMQASRTKMIREYLPKMLTTVAELRPLLIT